MPPNKPLKLTAVRAMALAVSAVAVLRCSSADPRADQVGGVYRRDERKLYAFHHAEDQEDMPPLPSLAPGFYSSIGSAVSSDGGSTWEKLGPVITSAKPKSWSARPNHGDKGAAVPSVVLDRDGTHLLAYYTEHSYVDGRSSDRRDSCRFRARAIAGT